MKKPHRYSKREKMQHHSRVMEILLRKKLKKNNFYKANRMIYFEFTKVKLYIQERAKKSLQHLK